MISGVVKDGERGRTIVFGDNLGCGGALGGFEACLGDKKGDIGDYATGSVVTGKEGLFTDNIAVLYRFGGESIEVDAVDAMLGKGFKFVGLADTVLVEVLPNEDFVKLGIGGGNNAVFVAVEGGEGF